MLSYAFSKSSNEWFYLYASVNYWTINQPDSSYFIEMYYATNLLTYGSDGTAEPSSIMTMSYPGTIPSFSNFVFWDHT